jgi:hypothetical protein
MSYLLFVHNRGSLNYEVVEYPLWPPASWFSLLYEVEKQNWYVCRARKGCRVWSRIAYYTARERFIKWGVSPQDVELAKRVRLSQRIDRPTAEGSLDPGA